MSPWVYVPLIIVGFVAFVVTSCEVSVRLGARRFREYGPDFEREARSRFRRAWWDGFTSLGRLR